MGAYYKSILIPIIAVIAIGIQLATGINLDAALQSQIVDAIVNVISVGAVVYGIFKNYQKPVE